MLLFIYFALLYYVAAICLMIDERLEEAACIALRSSL